MKTRVVYCEWLFKIIGNRWVGICLGRLIVINSSMLPGHWAFVLDHELKHQEQMDRFGVLRFYWLYLKEYIANRIKGNDHYTAYRMISFEREAYGEI